jgi:cell shape-determining protein MreC
MFNGTNYEHEIPINVLQAEIEHLRQENQRLAQQLKETQLLVDIHREASQILSLMLDKKRLKTSGAGVSKFDDRLIG